MSKASLNPNLISHVSQCVKLPLQLVAEVSNRRGAKLLELSADKRYFGLKVATEDKSSVSREAAVLGELADFAQLYVGSGYYDGLPWLLLEWVGGQSIYRYVKQLRDDLDPDTKPKLLNLFALVGSSVAELHALGYVHGDLQPDHFRLANDTVYLLDFALAHRLGENFNYRGALVHFSAPEICAQQLLGSSPVIYDELAELYSLASVIFFLYTGQLSADYGGEIKDLGGKRKRIAEGYRTTFSSSGCEPFDELERVLEKCLATDKQERYRSVADAARALHNLLPDFLPSSK